MHRLKGLIVTPATTDDIQTTILVDSQLLQVTLTMGNAQPSTLSRTGRILNLVVALRRRLQTTVGEYTPCTTEIHLHCQDGELGRHQLAVSRQAAQSRLIGSY